MELVDIIGFAGAAALLTGYYCVSKGIWKSGALRFQLVNLTGSVGILVNALHYGAYPAVILNIAWSVVALTSVLHIAWRYRAIDD